MTNPSAECYMCVWATGSAHDDKVLDWLFDLRYADSEEPIEDAIGALEDEFEDDILQVGVWQRALLAAECVAFLRGSPADLHDGARNWLERTRPAVSLDLHDRTSAVLRRVLATSSLRTWWQSYRPKRTAEWEASVTHLQERLAREG